MTAPPPFCIHLRRGRITLLVETAHSLGEDEAQILATIMTLMAELEAHLEARNADQGHTDQPT